MIFLSALWKFAQNLEIYSSQSAIALLAFPLDRVVPVDFGKREEILCQPVTRAGVEGGCGCPDVPGLLPVGGFGTIIAISLSRKVFLNKKRPLYGS